MGPTSATAIPAKITTNSKVKKRIRPGFFPKANALSSPKSNKLMPRQETKCLLLQLSKAAKLVLIAPK